MNNGLSYLVLTTVIILMLMIVNIQLSMLKSSASDLIDQLEMNHEILSKNN